LGICFNPNPHPDLETKPLSEGTLLVGVRKGHPLAKRDPKKWMAELSQYPAFLPKAFQGIEVCETHPVFKKFGIVPKVSCLVDSYESAVSLVVLSDGWGFFPAMVQKLYPDLKLLSASAGWEVPFSIHAVWSKHRFMTRALKS
jgi:DNA-binding transcriptional LysR family regulator